MKRLIGIGIVGIAMASAPMAMADTVKVGLIMPFSGGYASWGTETKGGVEIYQQLHGKSVNGTDIEIIMRDEGGIDPARSKELATELILRDHVQFLTGFAFSPDALAIADVITEAKIPTIITNAATGYIPPKSPYYVRASFALQQDAAPLGTWAATHGIKTVVSVIADYVSGMDSNDGFVKTFTAAGGKVLDTIKYPVTVADITPYYERVLTEKPDAIYVFGTGGANEQLMVKTWANRLKPEGIAFIGALQLQQNEMPSLGDATIGLIQTTHYPEHDKNPLNVALWKQWYQDYGANSPTAPDMSTVSAYDAIDLVYRAVAKYGPGVTGDQAMELYKGLTVLSPRGSFTIDPKTRDIIQNIYVEKVGKVDGQLQNIQIDVIKDVKDPWKESHPE